MKFRSFYWVASCAVFLVGCSEIDRSESESVFFEQDILNEQIILEREQSLPAEVRDAVGERFSEGSLITMPFTAGDLDGTIHSLTCGQELDDELADSGQGFAADTCNPSVLLPGAEFWGRFNVPTNQEVSISLKNFSYYPFITILNDLGDPITNGTCAVGNWYSVRFAATAGDYTVVVDTFDEDNLLQFDMKLDCAASAAESLCDDQYDNDADWEWDCDDDDCSGDAACSGTSDPGNLAALSCNETVSDSTGAFSNSFDRYGCNTQFDFPGAEQVYTFTAPSTEDVVFDFSNQTDYPKVVVLNDSGAGIDPYDCVSMNWYSTTAPVVAGQDYYVVVDGFLDPFDYDLSLSCPSVPTESDCQDGADNDGDGDTDCADEECVNAPNCYESDCADVVDNDGDGDVDCADTECAADDACAILPESGVAGGCSDGTDNDGDNDIDCFDSDCAAAPWCQVEDDCYDDTDNDGDGDTDCADTDCDCVETAYEGGCSNGTDDDGDGDADCADSDCFVAAEWCGSEVCVDSFDNDGDGSVDCADPDCASDSECIAEVCDNQTDDDGDGFADCVDDECYADPYCNQPLPEDGHTDGCIDGTDNDGDGDADCADSDCAAAPWCQSPEVSCSDNYDNDVDGSTDCFDEDCWADPVCNGGETVTVLTAPITQCIDFETGVVDSVPVSECVDPEHDLFFGPPTGNTGTKVLWNHQYARVAYLSAEFTDIDSADLVDLYFCDTIWDTDPRCLAQVPEDGMANRSLVIRTGDGNFFKVGVLLENPNVEVTFRFAPIDMPGEDSHSDGCSDGSDNDLDGDIDCFDSDCASAPWCQVEDDCYDGADNDGDGDTDCADTDCDCVETAYTDGCSNGTDDDGDGDADCADLDCSVAAWCGSEVCVDSFDNDGDGDVDCADSDCALDVACLSTPEDGYIGGCSNGGDDDGDGDRDCADLDCVAAAWCGSEICDDDFDNDGDGLSDCTDSDCVAHENCVSALEPAFTDGCLNGSDDDGDGDVDCADADCQAAAPWCEQAEVSCTDLFDNDGDGSVDCADSDCAGDSECIAEICDNDLDDDNDGLIDCFDDECYEHEYCNPPIPETGYLDGCSNGSDDDGDGDVDCADSDCSVVAWCEAQETSCVDSFDNDGDGATDCSDSDCSQDINCQPEICDDGEDNNNDGVVDCDDSGCAATPVCWAPCDGSLINLANSFETGGSARVVEYAVDDPAAIYTPSTEITAPCTDPGIPWRPSASICDLGDPDDPSSHVAASMNHGATWRTGGGSLLGMLVVDLGDPQQFDEMRVFQMFSDGKTTEIELFVHPQLGGIAPLANDPGWLSTIDGTSLVGPGVDLNPIVFDPTLVPLGTQVSQFVRVNVRNDGRYGSPNYTELRAIKLFCSAPPPPPEPETQCYDGQDNDEDGLTDCADPDCDSCNEAGFVGGCSDGTDNDLDGEADCADVDCAAAPWCAP